MIKFQGMEFADEAAVAAYFTAKGRAEARKVTPLSVTVASLGAQVRYKVTTPTKDQRAAGVKPGDVVTEPRKGNVIVNGLGRFPVTLYAGQIPAVVDALVTALSTIVGVPDLPVDWNTDAERDATLDIGRKVTEAWGNAGLETVAKVTIEKPGTVTVKDSAISE